MTAIAFNETSLLAVRRVLSDNFPDAKSAHIAEALAAASGFKTNAALRAELAAQNQPDPDFLLLDKMAFLGRLRELSAPDVFVDDYWAFEFATFPPEHSVKTYSSRADDVTYTSKRSRAWRNMMVSAINAGQAQRLFTVRAGDNRWPGVKEDDRKPFVFQFEVDGIPAVGTVHDAGWDELALHVIYWPTEEGAYWAGVANAGFRAGEAFASGWMERRDGAWLQSSEKPTLQCRKPRLEQVAGLTVQPRGYADKGSFKL